MHVDTQRSFALSLFVLGNDVYVAGEYSDSNDATVAVFWKNGVATRLGSTGSVAYSIFVK